MEQMNFFSKPSEPSDKEFYYKNFILQIVRNFRQKTLYLSITKNGCVRISCGKSTSIKQICAFIDEHQNWIERQLLGHLKLRKNFPKKQLLSGELFPFCGDNKALRIIRDATSIFVTIKDEEMHLHWPQHIESKNIMQAIQKFYKQQGENLLTQKIHLYSKQMNLYPSKVSFRAQKSLFGSCSEDGRISLNWTLAASPHFVMDYVVIHELAHLKYLKHSKKFWKYVKQHDPFYLKAEKWLKTKFHQIEFLSEMS